MEDETKSLKPSPQAENKSSPGPVSAPGDDSSKKPEKDERAHGGHSAMNRAEMKRKAKKFAMWGGAAVVLILLIAIVPRLFRRHELAKDKNKQENALPSVTVIAAKSVPPRVDLELSGTMSALTEAPILARADGYLVKRFVDIGDRVHKGQLMAVIDSPELDQQVRQARAALQETRSELEQAKSNLGQARANQGLAEVSAQRWGRLQEKGAVSRQENDTYQANYQAQTANVDASTANVSTATHNISASEANLQRLVDMQGYEQVRSPFEGIVTARNLDVGALITQGSTLLFRVAQIDVLRTYIEIPQTNAAVVKVGDPVWITFAEYPGHSFSGAITRTANSLDTTTRTMLTEVQLPNEEHKLLPGMYAEVKLSVPTIGSAVVIPGESMIVRADGPIVATVTDQNAIHMQQINVGHDYGNTVEVLGGLTAGQKVVVNPGDSVIEGAKVNPVMGKDQPENPASTGSGSPGQAAPKSQGQSQDQSDGQSQAKSQGQSDDKSQGKSQEKSKSKKKEKSKS
jgi:RND family efflux transporter MFP subunit